MACRMACSQGRQRFRQARHYDEAHINDEQRADDGDLLDPMDGLPFWATIVGH